MRYAFVDEVTDLAKHNKDIMLLTADLGFTVFEEFASKFPKQFLNVGVAESNMISLAAGLALSGKIVYAYSIATFATIRTLEQIKIDVCLHNAAVTIIGSGAGFSYSDSGPTHNALEDLAIMRTLPNITIFSPADPIETRWATRKAAEIAGPVYIRLGKKGEPMLYESEKTLKVGKASELKHGKDIAIFATGNIVENTLKAAVELGSERFDPTVFSMHTIKPIDKKTIVDVLKNYKLIVSVEEHTEIGGLGSAIAEVIAEYPEYKKPFLKISAPDTFTVFAGHQPFIRGKYGLNPKQIARKIKTTYNAFYD